MAQERARPADLPNLSDVYERLNTTDKLFAKLTTVVEGQGAILAKVEQTVEGLANAFRTQSAREPMSFLQMMGGAALVLGVGGSLATLIIVFVSSVYDGRLAAGDQRVAFLETIVAARTAEERAELIERRKDDRLALGERLKAIEERSGWLARATPAAP